MTGRTWRCRATRPHYAPGSPTTRTWPQDCALTGARTDEVVAMNSLTVNLHLMLASFYRPQGRRRRILIEAGAFSSDRHAVTSQIAWRGLEPASTLTELAPAAGEDLVSEESIEALLAEPARRLRWCCGRVCSSAPARPSTLPASPRPRTGTAAWQALTSRTPSATSPCRCTMRTRTSRCGAATSTSTQDRGRSVAASSTSATAPQCHPAVTPAHCPEHVWPAGGATRKRRAFACSPSFAQRTARPPGS